MSRVGWIAAMAVVGGITLAGCGGSSSSSSSAAPASTSSSASATTSSAAAAPASSSSATAPSGGGSVAVSADPGGALAFNTKSLHASAGHVKIAFTNQAPEPHNFTIATSSGSVVGATPSFQGGTKTLSVDLKPGTYTYYCTIPGHRQGGMQGTLTVS